LKKLSKRSHDEDPIKRDASAWKLEYKGFSPSEEKLRESLCTLANGYFGTRGASNEASDPRISYPGTYIAGVYNKLATRIAGGRVLNEDLVNCPNWLPVTFRLEGGEWISLEGSKVISNKKTLDFYRGILSRQIVFADNKGRKVKVSSERMVHMTYPHIGAIKYVIEPLDYEGFLYIKSTLDGAVENDGVARYSALRSRHLNAVREGSTKDGCAYLEVKTSQSGIKIALASKVALYDRGRKIAPEKFVIRTKRKQTCHDIKIKAKKGHSYRLDKITAIYTSRDQGVKAPLSHALSGVRKSPWFDSLKKKQEKEWAGIWDRSGILLKGGPEPEKAVNFHAFHLLQSATKHNAKIDAALGARGLHGEAYRGHIFWDELFAMPFYDYQTPEVSRAILKYRYKRLDKARKYAKENGYKGAMFPWQSGSTGEEETQVVHLNPMSGKWGPDHSRNQRHVSFAIAYNVWKFWERTGDRSFMNKYGREIFLSIAQFCSSLSEFSDEDKRYHTHGLMGPDEFHEKMPLADEAGYTDNAYSNVFIAWILARACELVKSLTPGARKDLFTKCGIRDQDPARWQDISRGINLSIRDDGVIEQFKGFFTLKELNWDHYREKYGDIHRMDRILKSEGKSPNEYKVAKQADVLMMFYVFPEREVRYIFKQLGYHYSRTTLKKNYDYYVRRTSHGSTLSKVVHCYLAHAMKQKKKAWNWYLDVLSSDIDDIQGGTTPEGIHVGVMGGSLDIIMRGFMGLDDGGGILRVAPGPPAHVKKIVFEICYRKRRMRFSAYTKHFTVEAIRDRKTRDPFFIEVYGAREKIVPGKKYNFDFENEDKEAGMGWGKVLIVDGDMTWGEKLADRLHEEGFQARTVSKGEDALDILKREWMDMVLLSIKLRGEMDGFHLIKTLKEDPGLSRIPVVMESDKPGMKDVFLDLGAEGFFIKPCSLDDIIKKTKKILADI
jgi:trehalose/maltose hydrolase-like predicted phosphorylase/CheY-like chemotaxis protein